MSATRTLSVPGAAEAPEAEPLPESETRRNFALGVANGSLVQGSFACIAPSIILAPLILDLTGSVMLAGVVGVLQQAFFMLPQMAASAYIESLPRKMTCYRICSALRALNWIVICAAVAWLGADPSGFRGPLLAGLIVAFLCVHGMLVGTSMLAFQDIVARAVPVTGRERFFGLRTFFGRLIQTALTFMWIPFVLQDQDWLPYPHNYVLLFCTGLTFEVPAMLCFLLVREPPGPPPEPRRKMTEQFRRARTMLAEEPHLRLLVAFRVLGLISVMALPLVAVYALAEPAQGGLGLGGSGAERTELTARAQSRFVVTLAVSEAVLAGVWSWIGGRCSIGLGLALGVSARLLLTTLLALAAPLLGWWGADWETRLNAVTVLYVLLGFQNVLTMIEMQSLVLELAPADKRPTFFGFLNTLSFPLMLGLPVLGGWVAHAFGYATAFAAMTFFGAGTLVVARRLGAAKRDLRERLAPPPAAPLDLTTAR